MTFCKNSYMSKFKIINLIDKVFITVAIFLVIYAWINFFIRNLWLTFMLSLTFSFACVFLLLHFLQKQQTKKSVNKKYLSDIEEKFLAFRLMNNSDQLNLIANIISKESKCEIKNNCLLFEKDNKTHQILIATHIEILTQFELINLLRKLEKNIDVLFVFCCDSHANSNTEILKDLEVKIFNKKKIYDEFFMRLNTFPDCSKLQTKKEKIKLKDLATSIFVPHKAKSYFLCGLVLIFSSIILPYHTYYLIFGSLLLIFSVICKLRPFFKRY